MKTPRTSQRFIARQDATDVLPDLSLRQAKALLAGHHPETLRKTPRSRLKARLAAFVRADMENWSPEEQVLVHGQLLVLAGEIQAPANGFTRREAKACFSLSRRFAQLADEPSIFPALPKVIFQAPQSHSIPIAKL